MNKKESTRPLIGANGQKIEQPAPPMELLKGLVHNEGFNRYLHKDWSLLMFMKCLGEALGESSSGA